MTMADHPDTCDAGAGRSAGGALRGDPGSEEILGPSRWAAAFG